MNKEIKKQMLENRLNIIKSKNKKGSAGVIKKIERQLRNLT